MLSVSSCHQTNPNKGFFSNSSKEPEFQINAILSRSLQFTKLQCAKFSIDDSGPIRIEDDMVVDQEILNAAQNVIPNIVIEIE